MPRRIRKPPDWEHAREAFFSQEPRPLIGMEVRCAWCRNEPLPCTSCWHESWQLKPMLQVAAEKSR